MNRQLSVRTDTEAWERLIPRLRGLWSEGHSTAEIGRRLGVSKNAVVGKAHRLGLPDRPSPIHRDKSSVTSGGVTVITRRVLPSGAVALPPLSSAVTAPPSRSPDAPRPLPTRGRPIQGAALLAALAPLRAPERPVCAAPAVLVTQEPPQSYGGNATCCWPIGEPGTRSFRFCDDPVAHKDKPQPDGSIVRASMVYCAAHGVLATVRVRERHEDAA